MTRRVYNRRHGDAPAEAVYVGRPSKWGNPFVIGRDGSREQAIELYRRYLYESGLINAIGELTGRDLVCWCAPKPCHADLMIELANGADDDRRKAR